MPVSVHYLTAYIIYGKCGIFLRVHVHFCSSSNLVLEPNALGVYLRGSIPTD